MSPKTACGLCETYSVFRSRGVVLALLIAFSACARPLVQTQKPLIANRPPPKASSDPSAHVGPTPLESHAGDQITVPGMGSTSTPVSSPELGVQPPSSAHAEVIYYLLVIGPPEQFWKIATTPSDPEVVYVEEASQLGRDGRREKLVMTTSKAAIRRFKTAAEKLGMEVRALDGH